MLRLIGPARVSLGVCPRDRATCEQDLHEARLPRLDDGAELPGIGQCAEGRVTALEAFTRCAAAEYHDLGVRFTVVNMPLVRTAVAPSRVYERFPLLRPEQAAGILCKAVIHRPARLAPPLGRLAQMVEALAPGLNRAVMSESYRLLPELEAAGGQPGAQTRLAPEALAIAALLHGVRG